jgi:hypothetical protein
MARAVLGERFFAVHIAKPPAKTENTREGHSQLWLEASRTGRTMINADTIEQLKRIVGASVTVEPCAVCGGQVALESVESVADSGERVATIQFRCHGTTSSLQVKASDVDELRIVPFENAPTPQRAKDRLGGIVMGPFRGGISR